MRVVIIGAGGHAQVVADILQQAHAKGTTAFPIAFLDETIHSLRGNNVYACPYMVQLINYRKSSMTL